MATSDKYLDFLGVDRALGRILDALERAGRLENTLIVFTSDNGILHGEHRWTKKEAAYEEAIRVPLVYSNPRLLQNIAREGVRL